MACQCGNKKENLKKYLQPLEEILEGIKQVLESTPPELSGDIIQKGVVITGGGAQLAGLAQYFSEGTGVAFFLAEDPVGSVVKGTAQVLENMDYMSSTLISNRKVAASF